MRAPDQMAEQSAGFHADAVGSRRCHHYSAFEVLLSPVVLLAYGGHCRSQPVCMSVTENHEAGDKPPGPLLLSVQQGNHIQLIKY